MELNALPGTSYSWLNVGTLKADARVGCVELNRPGKSNAFHSGLWEEFPRVCHACMRVFF
jgi:enoyl-CoA hydratase/carnithine racemase